MSLAVDKWVTLLKELAMKKLSVLLLLAYASMMLTACNTVEGFGSDVSHLGAKIENKADQEKRY
jgi:predicted small secreted protein